MIEFQECISHGKTKIFDVVNKETGKVLGQIEWSSNLRQYAYYSFGNVVYSQDCMRDIADKLKELMEERKK